MLPILILIRKVKVFYHNFTAIFDTKGNDDAVQTALIKRDENLTPNPNEQTAITNLVNTIQSVLDGLIVSGSYSQKSVFGIFVQILGIFQSITISTRTWF